MPPWQLKLFAALGALVLTSCGTNPQEVADLPIETGFAFTNFSTVMYAALDLREHGADGAYFQTALLAPGATQRGRFADALGKGCPDSLDFRLLLYSRINSDIPIGLDDGEAVRPEPVVAGEILGVPACGVQPVETYTIVSWDAEASTARVKLAQFTPVDDAIREQGLFPNADAAWEISGVDPTLADMPPPDHAAAEAIAGRVTMADGPGAEDVGVLLRTRFRVRLDDDDPNNDPDAGYGQPIALTFTDAEGRFEFHRPPGAYRVEVFSDDLLFRPAVVDVESPVEVILIVAEPL